MIRIEIMNILEKHLKKIDGLTYGRWLAGEIDSDLLPIIDVRDKTNSLDNDSGHTLHIEIELQTKSKARSNLIDESLVLMQQIAHAVRDAVEEMCLHGRLRQNDLDAERSEYKFIGSLLKFEIDYTADEWSV
jgi:hypothetical protein